VQYVNLTKGTYIFIRDEPIISSERMLVRTMTARARMQKKKSLVVGLKGLGAKTN
jgi:hypothetical protein